MSHRAAVRVGVTRGIRLARTHFPDVRGHGFLYKSKRILARSDRLHGGGTPPSIGAQTKNAPMQVIRHPASELQSHTHRRLVVLAAENFHPEKLAMLHRIPGARITRVPAHTGLPEAHAQVRQLERIVAAAT